MHVIFEVDIVKESTVGLACHLAVTFDQRPFSRTLNRTVRVGAGAGRCATAIEKGTQSLCGYNKLH